MHRGCIAAHIIRPSRSIFVVGVVFVRGEQALLVPAMRAAHEYGFMPEAYGGAERVALAGRESFSAFFADIFFFGGVLCTDISSNAKPEEKKRYAEGYCESYDGAHCDLLINNMEIFAKI